jgi:hypothetical protein
MFWQKFLSVWAGLVTVFGLVLAGAAFEVTDGIARALFALLNGPGEPSFDGHLRFSVGLMGAVTMGWGLTFYPAFKAIIALGDAGRPYWRMIAGAALAWYVIDSAISIATGFGLNAVSNTILIAALLMALVKSGALRD